ncbi:phosphohistidine phosphatase SixA [Candidatus Pantoea edessiphila]|uniref:Phosphohistidine phosphatase SixA n=1 Tax=Candidatus Pantoea edessiphila TaxID=2044610 RepID=A0A2P5T2Y0_9GAMM|nr:phosphohistidine phosphatase SixA [Candidatus Pantoea edessiphila]PPI88900.1 phosphohistidine phosphatase SixA [Candidatus Pantoea edessiphila]
MQIFIMRHGDALLGAKSDKNRSLTLRGINESCLIANWLKDNDVYIESVLISPYKRTIQTFLTIKDILKFTSQDINLDLTPDGKSLSVIQYIKRMQSQGIKSVLLISHLPLIINLINVLCPEEKLIEFATSSIVFINFCFITKKHKIVWLINPSDIIK